MLIYEYVPIIQMKCRYEYTNASFICILCIIRIIGINLYISIIKIHILANKSKIIKMDLSKIISISGMSGLYKVVAQGKAGLIVESMADKKRMPVHASSKVSVLDNISMYLSSGDNIPVAEVLKKIFDKQAGAAGPDAKSADAELVKFFAEVLPDYDKEKVHTSDIRKAIVWYNLLQKTDIFTAKEEEKKDDTPLIIDDGTKKTEHNFSANQGKQLNSAAAPGKKTIGVRKTGVA